MNSSTETAKLTVEFLSSAILLLAAGLERKTGMPADRAIVLALRQAIETKEADNTAEPEALKLIQEGLKMAIDQLQEKRNHGRKPAK